MKHIFIVNRFSLRERLDKYLEIIKSSADELKLDYKIEIRVVSMPNLGRFLKQSDEYIENILPVEVRKIVVEASSEFSWNKLIMNNCIIISYISIYSKTSNINKILFIAFY